VHAQPPHAQDTTVEYSGALQIVPGSHKAGTPPPPGTVDPPGAIDVLVKPGTAVFFEYVCTYPRAFSLWPR